LSNMEVKPKMALVGRPLEVDRPLTAKKARKI